ncbi:MAG: lipopolysaccharide kinase InaA family protein [Planctomycetota bacterium]
MNRPGKEPRVLAQSRTVRVVRRRREDGVEVVEKTYSFPTRKDRIRGMLRGTWVGRNKARREYANLKFLEQAGIPVVEALEWKVERNGWGFVTWCRLSTRAYDAMDLARTIRGQSEDVAEAVWEGVGSSLRAMHDAGIWHRGASARNILLIEQEPYHLWLDPTKAKTYPAGGIPDAARALDLLRLWTSLTVRATSPQRAAFTRGYGSDEIEDMGALWSHISPWKKASTRREMQREEARL